MQTTPEVAVTLSAELFRRLRREARRLGLPLEWLIASLVADTIEETGKAPVSALA